MKVEIFQDTSSESIQEKINEWLDKNPKIIPISQEIVVTCIPNGEDSSFDDVPEITVALWYEPHTRREDIPPTPKPSKG